jgi:hypothetical protein
MERRNDKKYIVMVRGRVKVNGNKLEGIYTMLLLSKHENQFRD